MRTERSQVSEQLSRFSLAAGACVLVISPFALGGWDRVAFAIAALAHLFQASRLTVAFRAPVFAASAALALLALLTDPIGASCLILLALSLAARTSEKRRAVLIAQVLEVFVAGITFFALTAFLFGADRPPTLPPFTGITSPAAGLLLLLSMARLALRPHVGITAMFGVDEGVARFGLRLLAFVLVAPVLVGWLRVHLHQAGLVSTEFTLTSMVVTNTTFLGALVLYSFKRVGELTLRKRERAERERYFNLAPDLHLIVSDSGRRRMNPAFERLLGYSREEIEAKPLSELVHPEDRERFDRALADLLRTQAPARWEVRYRCRDGSFRWLDWNAVVVDGEIYASARDLTDQLAAEEKLRHQETQLLNAAKLAALGEMAGGMAHEINNPLQVISGNARLLRKLATRAPLDLEGLNEASEAIERTVERIARITYGLRVFAHGATELPLETARANALIEETLLFCQEKFKTHGVTLEVSPLDREVLIPCRPGEVEQILLNLLNNAFHAVEGAKEKWIGVSLAEVGDEVEFAVSDSGPGVPPGIRDKIFQPFFTTKPAGIGTGLGLSISSGLARAHRGELRLEDRGGRTRFTLRLPKSQDRASA
jgi:PAS domain S-box-containing protein